MILGLIPARGGSKGIPNKNLVDLGGKPLLARSIEPALSSVLDTVVVTSDSREILDVAEQYGATALERPAEFATDTSSAAAVISHALSTLTPSPTYVCYLQPTSPFRRTRHIDEAVALAKKSGSDTVVSVMPVPHAHAPGSVMKLDERGRLHPAFDMKDPLHRQSKPVFYARNGPAVLIIRAERFIETGTFYDGVTHAYVMDRESSLDIDDPFDLKLARLLWAAEKSSPTGG